MAIQKYVKIGVYELAAMALIVFGTLLRVVLVGLQWPLFNSDEGTMGIMALHIASRGDHPVFYYGQHFMGTLDAYLAAGVFRVLGPSILMLRGSMLLLYVPFLLVMYGLTRLLYSKQMALGCLLILSLGSIPILILEVRPLVYADILVLGACAFLLACGLALSASPQPGQPGRGWRVLPMAVGEWWQGWECGATRWCCPMWQRRGCCCWCGAGGGWSFRWVGCACCWAGWWVPLLCCCITSARLRDRIRCRLCWPKRIR